MPATAQLPTALRTALYQYQAALATVEPVLKPASLLVALRHRDQIAALLRTTPAPVIIPLLIDLDSQLSTLAQQVPWACWQQWRKTFTPPADAWWWRFDSDNAEGNANDDHGELPWHLLAGALMTLTLGLALDLIQRLWAGGVDSFSLVSTVVALFLAGSPLAKPVRELAAWVLRHVAPQHQLRKQTLLIVALLACLFVLLLRGWAVTGLAHRFNNSGARLLDAGDLVGAEQALTRAVNLNPTYATAYYNLGQAYALIGAYDKATTLHQKALATNNTLDLAYSGLGHTLLQQGQAAQAIPILYAGLAAVLDPISGKCHPNADPDVCLALWADLGRAYQEVGRYHAALAALNQALDLQPQDAPAHCTLAQTQTALAHPTAQIQAHWENCLRYAGEVEPPARALELAALARAGLQALEEGRP